MKYTLINYFDVWGNSDDGYEVNNLCNEGNLDIVNDTNDDILQALKDFGFINDWVKTSDIDIWNNGYMIELFALNGLPICRLEAIDIKGGL